MSGIETFVDMTEFVRFFYKTFVCGIFSRSHCVAETCGHEKTKRDSVAFCSTGFLLGRCLYVVFDSIFDLLCVVRGARLACCNFSWLHTQWWFSLVPDPIIYAP